MKRRTKRVLGGLAFAAGSLGALGVVAIKRNLRERRRRAATPAAVDVWARPGMSVTFRAELMPGRDRAERTFRVKGRDTSASRASELGNEASIIRASR